MTRSRGSALSSGNYNLGGFMAFMGAIPTMPLTAPTANGESVAAPIGGWNTISPVAEMPPTDAILLDNFEPRQSNVQLRRGYRIHTTGGMGGGNVDTLAVWSGQSGSAVLVGAANGNLYNCSTLSAAATSLASGYSSNQWQTANFRDTLLFFNGADTPQKYDGSTVSAATYTSATSTVLDPTKLINPTVFKSRVYIVEKNSMRVWYGATNAITGALTDLDVGSLTLRGGYLMACGSWSRDSGNGPLDLFVMVTSEGEVLAYSGSDPSNSNWSQVSRFRTGKPIGRRCLLNVGPDLVLITQDGLVPLASILQLGRVDDGNNAISSKINPSFITAAASTGSDFGWQGILYPLGNKIYVNIPITSTQYNQYVVNTITGSWCRFKGMNARCWVIYNDKPYFGTTDGKVCQADYGLSDGSTGVVQTDGANITGEIRTAWQYFGGRGFQKQFKMVRPVMGTTGPISLVCNLLVDFQQAAVDATVSPTVSLSPWDTSPWDTSAWSDAQQITRDIYSVAGIGYAASFQFKVATNSISVSLNSIDIQYERGGML